jgi:hypothetical protein
MSAIAMFRQLWCCGSFNFVSVEREQIPNRDRDYDEYCDCHFQRPPAPKEIGLKRNGILASKNRTERARSNEVQQEWKAQQARQQADDRGNSGKRISKDDPHNKNDECDFAQYKNRASQPASAKLRAIDEASVPQH